MTGSLSNFSSLNNNYKIQILFYKLRWFLPKSLRRKITRKMEKIRLEQKRELDENARQDMCWLAKKIPDEFLPDYGELH